MSRRPANPNADRAAQNQQTLKTLVKVESNKSCADCKRNKHPRWASWNLGIFVCIRCSGIHRGMGTHISRVKSVDLDAWTDEQLQNMLRWGNSRANKYWEAKLAPGHVPAEAKIENFIRTKYDSKRWVMDGGMPDPATLDAGADDDVPLNIVQDKAKLERSASLRTTSAPTQPPQAPIRKANPDIDLFGDSTPSTDAIPSIPRNTTSTLSQTTTARAQPPIQPRQARNGGDSLLGFDFFGGSQLNVPARPSSAAASMSGSTGPSRPDLKQSILSLYASGSRTATPSQPSGQPQQTSSKQSSSLGGLDNDFASLNFSPQANPQPSSTSSDVFSNLGTPASGRPAPATSIKSPPIRSPPAQTPTTQSFGGGGFFDAKPSIPAQHTSAPTPASARPNAQRGFSASSGFGDFESATSPISAPAPTPAPSRTPAAVNSSSNGLGDMFDFSASSPVASKAPIPTPSAQNTSSPFNLSNPVSPTKSTTQPTVPSNNRSPMLNMDPWGSNDAWASAGSTTNLPSAPMKSTKAPATLPDPSAEWGWNGSESSTNNSTGFDASVNSTAKTTRVAPDEDFGGWESSTFQAPAVPQSKPQPPPSKPSGGFASNDNDLFSNVWE